jgi:hypothetical protein
MAMESLTQMVDDYRLAGPDSPLIEGRCLSGNAFFPKEKRQFHFESLTIVPNFFRSS